MFCLVIFLLALWPSLSPCGIIITGKFSASFCRNYGPHYEGLFFMPSFIVHPLNVCFSVYTCSAKTLVRNIRILCSALRAPLPDTACSRPRTGSCSRTAGRRCCHAAAAHSWSFIRPLAACSIFPNSCCRQSDSTPERCGPINVASEKVLSS